MSPISRCTAKATSSIRASTTPRNIPVAARTRQGHTQRQGRPHHAEARRAPLLPAFAADPEAAGGRFDRAAAAARREPLFNGKARCATCHVPPLFTEPGWNLHTAEEIGIDDFQAKRSPDGRYRTAPLRALWSIDKIHKGGFYHDGRFATLDDVVDHYDGHFKLSLSTEEKRKPYRVSEILVIASQGASPEGLPPRPGPHHQSSNFSVRFKAEGLAGLADRSRACDSRRARPSWIW